jgi:putative ABC transport system permease protein
VAVSVDTWQEIIGTLRKNKVRTLLTACGVFWGIFMLVLMLGFGSGLERGVSRGMAGFATNAVFIWGQRTSIPYQGLQAGRSIEFENGDITLLRKFPEIRHLSPRLQLGGWRGGDNVSRGTKSGDFTVAGDYPDLLHIQAMKFARGRFINDLDIRNRRKVAIIGPRAYEQLYRRGEDPIGTHIKIQGVYFTVVGQFAPIASGPTTERLENTVFIPFATFQQAFNFGSQVGWFGIVAHDHVDAAAFEEQLRAALAKRHRVSPEDRAAIGSFNAADRFGQLTGLFRGIRLLIWVVGAFTLLAGVIGVGNIMLIVVNERTKEIGIRKALGATPWSIMSQVVQEATALTALAGYVGLVAGVGALEVASRAFGESHEIINNPQVDFQLAIVATAVLVIAGAIAGFIPARAAAKVNPVEALRAE